MGGTLDTYTGRTRRAWQIPRGAVPCPRPGTARRGTCRATATARHVVARAVPPPRVTHLQRRAALQSLVRHGRDTAHTAHGRTRRTWHMAVRAVCGHTSPE
jgi:hypothetical protein